MPESGRHRFGSVAVSEWTGCDVSPRCHGVGAADSGRRLVAARRNSERLAGEPPDTHRSSRRRSPGFAHGWRRTGAGCQSDCLGEVSGFEVDSAYARLSIRRLAADRLAVSALGGGPCVLQEIEFACAMVDDCRFDVRLGAAK